LLENIIAAHDLIFPRMALRGCQPMDRHSRVIARKIIDESG